MIVIFSGFTLFEQETKETQYLFQNDNVSISGFGGFTTEFSTIQNEFAVLTGGGGAAIINQKFFFGGYGQGLSTRHINNELDTVLK